MGFKAILKLAWNNLWRNPRRSLTLFLSVAFGISALVLFQSFNNGMLDKFSNLAIQSRLGHLQIFSHDYYEKVYEKPWIKWINDSEDLQKKVKELSGVIDTYPRISFYGILQNKERQSSGFGEGVELKENQFFNSLDIIEGNLLQSESDIIMGSGLARSLGAKVGDTITVLTQTVENQLNGVDLKLVGIYETGLKLFDDRSYRMTLNQTQILLDTTKVEKILVQIKHKNIAQNVTDDFNKKYPKLEAIPFDEIDKVYYKNSIEFLKAQYNFIKIIISLIVILGVSTLIRVNIMERSKEIAAFRANGESRKRVSLILLVENLFTGIIGFALALVAIELIKYMANKAGGVYMPPGPGVTKHIYVELLTYPKNFIDSFILIQISVFIASLIPIYQLQKSSIQKLFTLH